MQITVQYTGQLAGITGVGEEIIELGDDATLGALVVQLCERHGAKYTDLLATGSGELRPSTMVVLDGEQALGNRSTIDLNGVKAVMLMTPIAGG